MTGWEAPAAILAGAGIGGAAWLLVFAARARPEPAEDSRGGWGERVQGLLTAWMGAGVVAAVATLVLTRWVVLAVAIGAMVMAWPRLFGAAREQQVVIARLEALAAWVESLRDTIAVGSALPEAVMGTAGSVSRVLARPLEDLVARMQAREPLDRALLTFGDDLADPLADQVVAALVLNARAQGRQLRVVLTSLASTTRKEVQVRRAVEADRRSTRRGTKIIIGATVTFVTGNAVFNREFVAPYSTLTGQLVLTVIVALFLVSFAWLRKLSLFETPDRFLATSAVRAAHRDVSVTALGRR